MKIGVHDTNRTAQSGNAASEQVGLYGRKFANFIDLELIAEA